MSPLRYAILHHDGIPAPHFDLMFETFAGSALATWRCPCWPIVMSTRVERLKDHRRAYLEFEGDVSGQRGRVGRIAEGICEVNIGEDALWTIRLLSGATATLVFRCSGGSAWDVRPA